MGNSKTPGRTVVAVAALWAALWSRDASATPMAHVPEEHPGHHHAAYPNLVGARVGFLNVIESSAGEAKYFPGIFGGLSYERTLVHEWLELEVSVPVAVAFGEETFVALPIDVHFKKPFHPSPRVSPYVAVGPAFDILVAPDTRVFFGGSIALGTYVWPSPRVGIDIELDYNLIAVERRPAHEVLIAVGPVLRF